MRLGSYSDLSISKEKGLKFQPLSLTLDNNNTVISFSYTDLVSGPISFTLSGLFSTVQIVTETEWGL